MLFQKLIAGPRHPSHTLPLGLPLMASYRREESLWSTWTSKPVFTLRYTNIHTHQRVYCMRKGEAVIGSIFSWWALRNKCICNLLNN